MAGTDRGRGLLIAGVLAIIGLALFGKGHVHFGKPDTRFAGMWALQHIPDGSALSASPPVRVDIPDAGVHAPLMRLRRNTDGTVQVPPFSKAAYAGWYDLSPAPGVRGASVLLGHLDDLHGAAAFYLLTKVRPADRIDVTRKDGTVAEFEVDATEKVAKTRFPTDRVYGSVRYAGLRLVTCAGQFDRRTRSYDDNLIVYAHLVGSRKAPAAST